MSFYVGEKCVFCGILPLTGDVDQEIEARKLGVSRNHGRCLAALENQELLDGAGEVFRQPVFFIAKPGFFR